MKRIARILCAGPTVLSLLLCLASAGFWVRSAKTGDWIGWEELDKAQYYFHQYTLVSARGGVRFVTYHYSAHSYGDFPTPHGHRFLSRSDDANWYPVFANWPRSEFFNGYKTYAGGGFELVPRAELYLPSDRKTYIAATSITLPHWSLVILFSLLPSRFLFRRVRVGWRARRRSRGLCPTCGYDLRASSERCPECGTAISETKIGDGVGCEGRKSRPT